jgi:hypothetical protein
MLPTSLSFSECGFGTTPRGLTTVDMTPVGRAEAAPASTISEIALVTNSQFSYADLEFGISLAIGGVVTHSI